MPTGYEPSVRAIAQSTSWTAVPSLTPRRWRGRVDGTHTVMATAVLGSTALFALAWPDAEQAMAAWGAMALLIGGALIGVPHGSSDFVVARRALKPTLGRAWLPAFGIVYLAIAALVLLGWTMLPLVTLVAFILLSSQHFGCDGSPGEERPHRLAFAVRATTPLVPTLLVHPANIAGLIALLGGVRQSTVVWSIDAIRWPLLLPWAVAVVCYVVSPMLTSAQAPGAAQRRDTLEVGAIALAAVTLPALLAFALYFCLVHAVRHMIGLADDVHPHDARRAIRLVTAIVAPSALVCLCVLASTWSGIAGPLGTTDVLAWSIRLVAALTVPHMALDVWVKRPAP